VSAEGRVEKRWIWPFELLDKLGEGGMGLVYRARYVGNNRMVAVKLLPDDVAANPTLVARFERELEVLKALKHPHIVHCFGGLCESKQRFYAMELVEGGTLHQLLSEVGKLPWETVVDYGLQMCSALEFAHARNVVHRDVKPANFLITRSGKLKLSDFGLAVVVAAQRITAAGKTMGTFHYMAPEQIRGKPPVSNRTDLYALGCVFFEMLTGNPPFDADSPAEVLHKHLKEPPQRVRELEPDCPLELDLLVRDLLHKDPEARPASASEVAERLKSASSNPTTTVSSSSLTPTIPRTVMDSDSDAAPAALAAPAAIARPNPANGLLAALAVLLLIWVGLAQWSAWHWKARAARSEESLVNSMSVASNAARLALIHSLNELDSLQPASVKFITEQLTAEDRNLRVAAVDLLIAHPDLARQLHGELLRIEVKGDPEPQFRDKVKEALKASKGSLRSSFGAVLLRWLIGGLIAVLVAGGGWYGWQWAKTHLTLQGT
jgi:serine/threonine-protein kinase